MCETVDVVAVISTLAVRDVGSGGLALLHDKRFHVIHDSPFHVGGKRGFKLTGKRNVLPGCVSDVVSGAFVFRDAERKPTGIHGHVFHALVFVVFVHIEVTNNRADVFIPVREINPLDILASHCLIFDAVAEHVAPVFGLDERLVLTTCNHFLGLNN